MQSMTGYAQAVGSDPRHRVTISLRSVNSRYLDATVRIKEEYRSVEAELRRRLEARVQRGRVDATVEIRPLQALPAQVEIQMEVVRALHAACHSLAEKGLVAIELSVGDLLRLPDVVEVRVEPDQLRDEDQALVRKVFDDALEGLVEARRVEGAQLRTLLLDRVAELRASAEALRSLAAEAREQLQERLRQRIEALVGSEELDDARLAQEVAHLVDRSDVSEELDRLDAHLEHFVAVVEVQEPIGKRLDFLTQEILRELNTLGAKARHAEITRLVLDAKVACEQLREQVQNVE